MKPSKTIIILGDGMADEPIESLGGRTPLQAARTPAMDSIARAGRNGTLLTLPDAFPTSSDVANMSVLGCDLNAEYCGRGALEAAGRGIPLQPGDIAFRVNLTTVEDGILTDFSGGHLSQEDAETLIAALNGKLGRGNVRFYPGVSYRNLLVLSGPEFPASPYTEKPDDNHGNRVAEHLPSGEDPGSSKTAAFLCQLIRDASAILEDHQVNRRARAEGRPPANGIWPWSGGSAASIRTLVDKFGVTSAVISAVDVINGLGRCLGMDVITVPGATGYIDTNYEGKADAALAALETHDLVYLHVEAIDEVSHAQDLQLKIGTIEAFDSRLVARVLQGLAGKPVTVVILPDHPVPVRTGKHTRTPVPVAIAGPGWIADAVTTFDECSCPRGSLGTLVNGDLMARLFGPPRPTASTGRRTASDDHQRT
jgi:2,3-bisphosphoglycerate-independent phosphoglycerate mutase